MFHFNISWWSLSDKIGSEWIMFCFGHPGVVIVRLFQTRTPATGRIMTNTWRSDLMISWHHDFDVSSRMSKGRFFLTIIEWRAFNPGWKAILPNMRLVTSQSWRVLEPDFWRKNIKWEQWSSERKMTRAMRRKPTVPQQRVIHPLALFGGASVDSESWKSPIQGVCRPFVTFYSYNYKYTSKC